MKQSSYLLRSLLMLLFVLLTATTANAQQNTPQMGKQQEAAVSSEVIELTSTTLDQNIRDGSIWFVEFYAPWCHHCNAFADTYSSIAHQLHNDATNEQERPIRIAKINADEERASVSRFNVAGFPAFFLIDGWTVYQYTGKRNEEQMIAYIRGGYKKQDPLPIWSSPMGPLGQLQALIFYIGNSVFSIYYYLVEQKGMTPAMAAFAFAGGGILAGLVTMITVAIVLSSKVKSD